MKKTAILLMIALMGISNAFATEIVKLSQGDTQFVELSNRDLNVILFPDPVKVLTQSVVLEIQIEGLRVFVSFKKDMQSEVFPDTPQQIYFLTNDRTYSMVAVPKSIPAVTVMVQTETETDANEGVDVSQWEGLSRVMTKKYVGAALSGVVYLLHNRTSDVVRLNEQEFYEKGVIAVSIDSHELQPDDETSLYLVRKLIITDDEDSGAFDVLLQ